MSDPIGALRGGVGGLGSLGGGVTGSMQSALGALTQEPGAKGRISGPDGEKTYSVDIGKGDPTPGPSFGDTIHGFINQVSEAQDEAGRLRDAFLNGEPVELHRVTTAAAEAGIALDLMVEMRNKVLEAYRTLITMQS